MTVGHGFLSELFMNALFLNFHDKFTYVLLEIIFCLYNVYTYIIHYVPRVSLFFAIDRLISCPATTYYHIIFYIYDINYDLQSS